MANLQKLDDSTLEEFIKNSDVPVFVDLWAEWCVPCRKVEPVIEDLAEQYKGKMKFTKLNTDENLKATEKFDVMSIPMFLILDKNMNVLEKFIGALPKQKFIEKIESSLKKN